MKAAAARWLLERALVPTMHRWPFCGGVLRGSNHALVWRLLSQLPDDAQARLRNGTPVRVRLQDFDGRMLYLFGTPDPRVVRVCSTLLRPGDCFLDIGANYGAVGMLCARAVQPGGVVHLFEPQPDLCTRILESLCSVPEPVVLHELGLMDHDGRLDLFQVSGHSGRASFVPDGSAPAGAVVHARVCNAATYVPPLLRGGSWAAKVDVEGAERHVVPLLLELPGLRFVAFEVSHQRDPGPLWDAVASRGLALFGMARSRFAAQLDPVASAGEMSRYEDLLVASLRPGVRIARRCSPRDLAEFVVPREPVHEAEDRVAPRRVRGRG